MTVPGLPTTGGVYDVTITFASFLSIGVALALLLLVFAWWWRRLYRKIYQQRVAFQKVVLLVTVPKDSAKDNKESGNDRPEEWQDRLAVAEVLYAAIGGLRPDRGLRAWLWGRQDHLALEIVAHQGLISFYVIVPQYLRRFVEQQIEAQYPEAMVEQVHDYNIFHPRGVALGAMLRLQRSFMFPLKTYRQMESDPLSSITNAMSRLGQSSAAVQVVIRSAHKSWHWHGKKMAVEMSQGKTFSAALRKSHPSLLLRGLWGFFDILSSPSKKKAGDEPTKLHQMTALEQEMLKGVEEKTNRAGVDANVRVVVSALDRETADHALQNILSAFAQYNYYQYGNQLKSIRPRNQTKLLQHDFIYRHYTSQEAVVLDTAELASFFHFPLPDTETPNIRWLRSKKAPAPLNMPPHGVVLGKNNYRGVETVVRTDGDDRQRHMYIIGMTGSGKSTLMQEMAKQDIAAGRGVCYVDPHGSAVDDIIECIPKERAEDVIYFDPSDTERPIGLNMLEGSTEAEMDFVTQEMISIFYKLVTDPSMIGPMFEHNMRNAMFTLMADQEFPGTIVEIPRIFTDTEFQKYKVSKVKDPVVRAFWEKEMAKTSDFHKSEMLGYLISKVGRFVENAMMRNIIGQPSSGFNMREIMDNKKILLVNLSKGKIGEINSNLLGLIIVSKLQMAAFGRADMPREQIQDFFLYIDEFQNFITDSIATILSEARKYKLDLIMAHQYVGQLTQNNDTKIRDAVFGNVGTMVSYRIGVEDSEIMAKQFAPIFNEFDLVNIDRYRAYVRLMINNTAARPFDMDAIGPTVGRRDRALLLKQLSRLKYGRDRSIVEAEILERSRLGEVKTDNSPVTEPRR